MEEVLGEIHQLKSQLVLAQAHREAFEVNATQNNNLAVEQASAVIIQKEQQIKELVSLC
jgi:hypothetical protein